ncbi:FG-GAP repeat domain-containing protein [Nocardioides sp. GXQ0305]|uniref:FG-GAP repeat domain-containing protein n=1 Tax=Nocardioides sp. GXQ0305 TaxID=3423912 RepID=UPI003D7DDC74
MKRSVLAPGLAVSLVAGLGAGLSARGAPPGASSTTDAAEVSSSRLAPARVRDITLRVDPRRRGLGAFADTWGDSLVFDKNRDGNPDVLLSFHTQPWEIWLGNRRRGFRFDRSLPRTDRHNCAVADFAGPARRPPDGRPDLYCVRGANVGTLSDKSNELLIQRAGGGFRNVVRRWGAVDPSGRGRTTSILDIRGNGRPSLFVGNAFPVRHPSRDHIYINRGRRFDQVRTAGLPSVQDTGCSATGDFDRDGRQDFLSCSTSFRLYRNRSDRAGPVSYEQVAESEGLPTRRWRDAGLVRLNGDRWRDLVLVSDGALLVRLNRRQSPHFPEVDYRFPLNAGSSFCSGRANGDNATDLLVVQRLASPTDRIQRRDWMLVNRGTGRTFRALPVPQPPRRNRRNGNGDTCTAIPEYKGQRAAWTISNGRLTPNPERRHLGYRQLVILDSRVG